VAELQEILGMGSEPDLDCSLSQFEAGGAWVEVRAGGTEEHLPNGGPRPARRAHSGRGIGEERGGDL